MTASNGRLFYEIVFWATVGTLAYLNRDLYKATENAILPLAQAYTPVVLFLIAVALLFLINYLREAIANTGIAFMQRLNGETPLNFEKGSLPRNIQKTARRLERKGNFQAAGEAYESLEAWRDAALVYERGSIFSRAAACWEKADNIGKAIEYYEKDGNFEAAGLLCQREGLQDRATKNFRVTADTYLEQNQFAQAGEFYERAGEFNKAGAVFEQAHKPDRALNCYEKGQNTDKILELTRQIHAAEYHRRGPEFTQLVQRSAEVLLQNGHGPEAARIMEDCHNLTRAAEIYGSCNMWEKAAELYLKAGKPDHAARAISKITDVQAASEISARLAVAKGEWSEAGRFYEAAGKQSQAIDAYKKARDFDAAAKLYEEMGRYIMAGEMFSSSRNFTAAANTYAKAYDWRNAAECFEESGDMAQAVEAYANAGNYLKAGILATRMTDYARAVEYLQRIPPGAPDFLVGTAYLATAFYYQGHYDMSYELFSRVMDELPINRDTLSPYYAYASQLEPDDPKKSLGLFRQILGVDIHYSDVSDRVHKLEQIVTSMSTGFGNTPRHDTPGIKPYTPLPSHNAVRQDSPVPASDSSCTDNSTILTQQAMSSTTPDNTSMHGKREKATSTGGLLDSRFQLQTELNQQGRVVDHLAVDTLSGKEVIVRTFPRPNDTAAYEATIELLSGVSKLSHNNINKIIKYGESGNLIYTVTPPSEGQTLKQWIRSHGPLSIIETQRLLGQLLEVLAYAHSHEVCHLNLRPDVVFIKENGEQSVLIAGFGAPVRQPETTGSIYLTMPDSDPQYLAPEQIIGSDVDSRTDIYALGLLLFFVLTGRTPFEVKRINDTQEIARMQVQVSLPRPSNIRATLPSSIDELFMKCVNKSPLSRYQTVSELLSDLRGIQTNSLI